MSASDRIEEYKRILADATAAADERATALRDALSERVMQLLGDVTERDSALWGAANAPGFSASEMYTVPAPRRGDEWHRMISSIWSAAYEQAWIELASRDMLTSADKHASKGESQRRELSKGELITAAVEGVTKGHVEEAKARRGNGES